MIMIVVSLKIHHLFAYIDLKINKKFLRYYHQIFLDHKKIKSDYYFFLKSMIDCFKSKFLSFLVNAVSKIPIAFL